MNCMHNIDGICVNADCPYRADYCPVEEDNSICRYRQGVKLSIGDKVHCTAYAERTGHGISIIDGGSTFFDDDTPSKNVVYYNSEKNELESIPYNEFTDVSVDKFRMVEKEFDGVYVGTTRLATKLTATYETPPYGDDYIRFESERYMLFAVIYYANNRKRLVPVQFVKGLNDAKI